MNPIPGNLTIWEPLQSYMELYFTYMTGALRGLYINKALLVSDKAPLLQVE